MSLTDFIATLALVTSFCALTYTIIVDRRTARLKVYADIRSIIQGVFGENRREVTGTYFMISITNRGPGRIHVTGLGIEPRSPIARLWFQRVRKKAVGGGRIIDFLPEGQQLPFWLEVAESATLILPTNSELLTAEYNDQYPHLDNIVLYDSLGKRHNAQRHAIRDARRQLLTEAET